MDSLRDVRSCHYCLRNVSLVMDQLLVLSMFRTEYRSLMYLRRLLLSL